MTNEGNKSRETFGSRLGFILVSAGCAIGIGNVWKFPFITGQNGGGLFVLIYLIFLVIMAALLALFIRSLVKLFRELEEPGYSINASASKVPDITAVLGLVAISVALLIGSFAANRVSMKWSEITAVSSSEAQSISADLSSQGVPADMLALLTEDELLSLKGGSLYAKKDRSGRCI